MIVAPENLAAQIADLECRVTTLDLRAKKCRNPTETEGFNYNAAEAAAVSLN